MEQSSQNSETYNIKSGEIFLTLTGDLKIHCTLCDNGFYDFLEYTNHTHSEHLPIITVEFYAESNHSKYGKEDFNNLNFLQDDDNNELSDYDVENALDQSYEENCSNDDEFKVANKSDTQAARKRTIQHDYDGLNNLYKCTICDFACKHYKNLVGHVKRHSAHKPHKCAECKKGFYTRFELKTHLRIHSGERPYLCNECGQSFITSGKLADHMKRHTNEKNYQCKICNRKFFNTQNMKRHLAVHSNERCYECNICQASFKRLTALSNHRKLHDNKKEYRCELCPARFNQRPGLYSHLKSKHTLSQVSCTNAVEEPIEVVY